MVSANKEKLIFNAQNLTQERSHQNQEDGSNHYTFKNELVVFAMIIVPMKAKYLSYMLIV